VFVPQHLPRDLSRLRAKPRRNRECNLDVHKVFPGSLDLPGSNRASGRPQPSQMGSPAARWSWPSCCRASSAARPAPAWTSWCWSEADCSCSLRWPPRWRTTPTSLWHSAAATGASKKHENTRFILHIPGTFDICNAKTFEVLTKQNHIIDVFSYLFVLREFGEQVKQRVQVLNIFGLELLVLPQEVLGGFGVLGQFDLEEAI